MIEIWREKKLVCEKNTARSKVPILLNGRIPNEGSRKKIKKGQLENLIWK